MHKFIWVIRRISVGQEVGNKTRKFGGVSVAMKCALR